MMVQKAVLTLTKELVLLRQRKEMHRQKFLKPLMLLLLLLLLLLLREEYQQQVLQQVLSSSNK